MGVSRNTPMLWRQEEPPLSSAATAKGYKHMCWKLQAQEERGFALCFGQAITSVRRGQKKTDENSTFLSAAIGKVPGKENSTCC